MIGVATILSSTQGIDPNGVEPHIIQDKAKTKNTTDLVLNRTTPDTKETGTETPLSGTNRTQSINTSVINECRIGKHYRYAIVTD